MQASCMRPLTEWHDVQVLPFGSLAMAGVNANWVRVCGFEIGAGEKAVVKANAATPVNIATTTAAQVKMANGHGRTRSRVGVQLKRALPRRGGACGRKGEGRVILPASRLRFSQKTCRDRKSTRLKPSH